MTLHQPESDALATLSSRKTPLTHLFVRSCGCVLLVVGMSIALGIMAEAWSLYRSPQNIERLARAVEQGSNLDHALTASPHGSTSDEIIATPPDLVAQASTAAHPEPHPAARGIRLSYFVAWVVAILLLMLIGRLAIAAVKTGGELTLYDLQTKRLVRELMREIRGP